jgi:hypothetical protein
VISASITYINPVGYPDGKGALEIPNADELIKIKWM